MSAHNKQLNAENFGADRPVLLVLDYPGRRPEAHISDLGLEREGFDCHYLLAHPLPNEVTAEHYAKETCARLPELPTGVVGVLSYCATAPLAATIASYAAGDDRLPLPVVFFDPSQCYVHHIVSAYESVVRQIDGTGSGDHPIPLLDIPALLAHPRQLVDSVAQDLGRRAEAALLAEGYALDEASDLLGQVTGLYLEWITYLVAVHHRGSYVQPGDVLHVVSRNHPDNASWLGADGPAQNIRIDCDRPSLLRDERTRDVVLGFLHHVAGRRTETART
ncbi:hypothetical protein [Actinacidiphila soli]|uniref:hypothetical protein n=1 Tax=Actinacidiphila soli TaxID=2487275 RepID=UPI0013E314B1|nr:hypothetical protein [Actinacidiphila soli]